MLYSKYKDSGTTPSQEFATDNPYLAEAEQLEQVCAGLSRADENRVYKCWDDHGHGAALGMAIGLKQAAELKQAATTKERTPHASPGMGLYEEALKELGEDAVHAVLKAAIDHYRAAQKTKSDPWQNPDYSRMTPR